MFSELSVALETVFLPVSMNQGMKTVRRDFTIIMNTRGDSIWRETPVLEYIIFRAAVCRQSALWNLSATAAEFGPMLKSVKLI